MEAKPAVPWGLAKYRQIAFLMEAGAIVDPNEYHTNPDNINGLIYKGVDYKDKTKRYWADPNDRDCFTIYARGLNITNGDRPVYWQWMTDSDGIEVAKVVKTRWLEVRGSFWTMNLSHNARYTVSFLIKTEETPLSTMNEQKVNLRLTLPDPDPDANNQEDQKTLPQAKSSDDNPWHKLQVGEFTMTAKNVGKIEFTMEQSFGRWWAGLVIKCVEIKADG